MQSLSQEREQANQSHRKESQILTNAHRLALMIKALALWSVRTAI